MEANKKGENYHNKKEGITKERGIKDFHSTKAQKKNNFFFSIDLKFQLCIIFVLILKHFIVLENKTTRIF